MESEKIDYDQEIEDRIEMEIVVDAYDEDERAMGWQTYMEDMMTFPFKAKCITKKGISPLALGEVVEVMGTVQEDDYPYDIFVKVNWKGTNLSVPLSQLDALDVDSETAQALGDWRYWLAQGYRM